MDLMLRGLTALVTGGASGIGAATVRLLAADGATVFVADKSLENAEGLALRLTAAGLDVRSLYVDVSDESSVRKGISAAGSIDLLVNAAGVFSYRKLEDIDDDEWTRVLSVNLHGVLRCVRAGLPALRRSSAGSITNVASLAGRTGGLFAGAHYAASKGAVIALTRSLALELAGDGIRVNCVNPGAIDTPMTKAFPHDVYERIVGRHPMRRLGTAEEAAAAIVFVASPRASYLTGAQVDVNGGVAMI